MDWLFVVPLFDWWFVVLLFDRLLVVPILDWLLVVPLLDWLFVVLLFDWLLVVTVVPFVGLLLWKLSFLAPEKYYIDVNPSLEYAKLIFNYNR